MGMGTLVGVDLVSDGTWQLSGSPCTALETQFIENQPDLGKTEVIITKDK